MNLNPDFPVVEGLFRLTREWELELPGRFNRRMEEGSMVLWRPGLTFWIAVWGREADKTPEETLALLLEFASPDRIDEKVDRAGDLVRLTYRLHEQDPERNPAEYTSISGYVIAPSGHVQITAYADDVAATSAGEQVIASVRRYAGGAR
jgi:hypothetical protein